VAEYTSPISGKKRQIPSPIEFLRAIGDYYQTLPQWTGPRRTGLANLPTDYRREELLAAGQVPGGLPADYKETELEAGRAAEAYRAGAGFPGQELAPAGLDLARPKPFAMTPEGQFDRYFKTPEMDQYFGAESRGKGAPADAAAMEKLAFEQKAPMDAPLATFYRAQSAAGRGNMPDIVAGITAGTGEKEAAALTKWAEANPMLAQRLYAKTNVGYDTPRMSPESEAMLKAVGGEQGEFITRQPGPNMPVGDTDIEQYEGERIIEAINDEKARKSGSVRDRADEFVGNLYSSYMK
jgi:hypothetical protein